MPTVRQQALQKIREALELDVDPLSLDMPVSVANEIKRILQEKPKKKAPRVKQPKQPKQSKSQNVKQSVKQTAKQQTQSTKQNVLVTVKNIINRRARQAPKQETRDTVTLQPKASMFANNLLTGNVSRYVQPAMSFAIPQQQFIPIQQSAIVDKPITKIEAIPQRPDVFAGEETNPQDIEPSYTPKIPPKIKFEDLPPSAIPESLKKMTRPMLFRQIEMYGVKPAQSTKKAELEAILQGLLESEASPSASASSSSASSIAVTPSSIRFLETLNIAPRPPMPPTNPEEEKGPAQAFGGPTIPVQEAIAPPRQGRVIDWTIEDLSNFLESEGRGGEMQDIFDEFGKLPEYSQKQVLQIIRGNYKK